MIPESAESIHAIGIMSGTSVDGIDAVLLEVSANQFKVVATHSIDFPEVIKKAIRALNFPGPNEVATSSALDTDLAYLYYQSMEPLLDKHGHKTIKVVGCHGQTIRHQPEGDIRFTVQLGNGALLAQLCGLPVVTDFRSADMAAGGQGAPLAPGFHHAAFASDQEPRAVINIGGISNITQLPSTSSTEVIGFDTGPGNTLMDLWIRKHRNLPFDQDATWAKDGHPIHTLLDDMLNDPYFAKPHPKSTGLDYFNLAWLNYYLHRYQANHNQPSPVDVQATLVQLTARSIADQVNGISPGISHSFICGGGAYNPLLMSSLQSHCRSRISSTQTLGIAPQWVEAAAFAWMANRTINQRPSTIPSVTGARKSVVAGAIYYP